MVDVSVAVMTGVITNVITSTIGKILSLTERRPPTLDKSFFTSDVYSLLGKAIARVARRIDAGDHDLTVRLRSFLGSSEVGCIARQLVTGGIDESREASEQKLEELFVRSFVRFMGLTGSEWVPVARELFKRVALACHCAVDTAIERNVLNLHEVRSTQRFELLLHELKELGRRIEREESGTLPTIWDVEAFELQYFGAASKVFGKISPPDLKRAERVPIDAIYVPPEFGRVLSGMQSDDEGLDLARLGRRIMRTVVLGNPGAGKTTFAYKLCHELIRHCASTETRSDAPIPLFVLLRDYGAWRDSFGRNSIIEFMEERCLFQIRARRGVVEYELLNGRALIVFDGLDELTDTAKRIQIRDEVEFFCHLYPSVPVLITSRIVGYDEAPMAPDAYEAYVIREFDDTRVEEYCRKWFALQVGDDVAEADSLTAGFLRESQSVSDLRSNPLMLGLMCNLYRGEGHIPRNRPDVYDKCANFLFEAWDRRRGIRPGLPVDATIQPAIQYLANWIHSSAKLQQGVPEGRLIVKAAEYLERVQFGDRGSAEEAAGEFIRWCAGRAWILSDTGSTAEGESLFQFTHRTFLEYFTARYLVSLFRTPEELFAELRPRILQQEWDIVTQLAFNIQSKQLEGAADDLLMMVCAEITDAENGHVALSFAARSLAYLVPSPRTIEVLITHTFEYCLKAGSEGKLGQRQRAIGVLRQLLCCRRDNSYSVAKYMIAGIERWIASEELTEAVTAYEIAENLKRLRANRPNLVDTIAEDSKNVVKDNALRVMKSSLSHATNAVLAERLALSKFLEWHGIEGMMTNSARWLFGEGVVHAIATAIMTGTCRDNYRCAALLEEFGPVLGERQLPMMKRRLGTLSISVGNGGDWHGDELSAGAVFGALLILCIWKECVSGRLEDLTGNPRVLWMTRGLSAVVEVRDWEAGERKYKRLDELDTKMRRIGLSKNQRAILRRWMDNELSLVGAG